MQASIDQKIFGETTGGREQLHRAFLQTEYADLRRNLCADLDAIAGIGAEAVVAIGQPVEADERKPALGSLEIGGALGPPRLEIAGPLLLIFPLIVLLAFFLIGGHLAGRGLTCRFSAAKTTMASMLTMNTTAAAMAKIVRTFFIQSTFVKLRSVGLAPRKIS